MYCTDCGTELVPRRGGGGLFDMKTGQRRTDQWQCPVDCTHMGAARHDIQFANACCKCRNCHYFFMDHDGGYA